jgi:hypothetical protein
MKYHHFNLNTSREYLINKLLYRYLLHGQCIRSETHCFGDEVDAMMCDLNLRKIEMRSIE